MKIVYCCDSISHLGGIQAVTITKANALAEISGNEIYIIVTDYTGKTIYPLNEKVRLIDLKINYYEDDWKSRFYLLRSILLKRSLHKQKLIKILNTIKPDISISVGTSEKYFLPHIKDGSRKIREIHYMKNYRWLHSSTFFDKTLAYIGDFIDFKINIRNYDRVIILTHKDLETNWKGNAKIEVMPNPITFDLNDVEVKPSNGRPLVVTAAGRLSLIKGYDKLIEAWSLIHKDYPDWTLNIWGEGEQKEKLKKEIEKYGLMENVFLKGYTNNIKSEMIESSIFVQTSLFEGFPLVLIEAMACQLPCIAFNCPYGPQEIIKDQQDGFLVPVNDIKSFAERLGMLMKDHKLRNTMSENSYYNVQRFSSSRIATKWMDLFHSI